LLSIHPNFWKKLAQLYLKKKKKPLFEIQENPPRPSPGLPGGSGCLTVAGNFALGNRQRIYRSSKHGPYNNRRGMVFEVYALVNFC
jgi:hypothetical protein